VSSRLFVEIDLRQAESRFVGYDSADHNLIGALEDPKRDIHSEVGLEILYALGGNPADRNDPKLWKPWRQLGKKSGHGANYAMKENTFIDSCLKEMNRVLTKTEATKVLEAYHKIFPGIRRWHSEIRDVIRTHKKLTNPFGRVRYFYGRMDDDTFREGFAYRPQSTIPDVTNSLMLALWDARTEGQFDFWFHGQIHDALWLSTANQIQAERVAGFCLNTKLWHPEIILPAGKLVIPTETKIGACMGDLQEYVA